MLLELFVFNTYLCDAQVPLWISMSTSVHVMLVRFREENHNEM